MKTFNSILFTIFTLTACVCFVGFIIADAGVFGIFYAMLFGISFIDCALKALWLFLVGFAMFAAGTICSYTSKLFYNYSSIQERFQK